MSFLAVLQKNVITTQEMKVHSLPSRLYSSIYLGTSSDQITNIRMIIKKSNKDTREML